MICPCGRKDVPGKPILYATTDNFLKRFKLKSLADLPDYDELMQKISEINAANEASSYLYEKEVYDPDKDPELHEEDEPKGKHSS
ncbi:MAG: SMC-Scp complex subunit ScpB, partial [Christensenellaceae bacterium]